ncbi:SgrR family transcriptional regulator [Enterobacter cloacae]|uniref:SgrR family transcriptional regulator n=1 Tax=Enterobacter cloacae TaxID=550 RepID=UPI001A923C4F|nr:SgrR family transcriptional regulator [Enterobacter cloacae]
MRQLQKIRQYQRLYQHYGTEPKPTTITEVAGVALCSERHARTLLRQLTKSGWLSWSAQPGRGHRAILHCLATTSELSAPRHPALPGDHQRAERTADACLPGKRGLPERAAAGRWRPSQPASHHHAVFRRKMA